MATSSIANTHPSPILWQREPQILRRRLLWLMGVRLLTSTLLMGGTVIFQLKRLQEQTHPTENFVFWLVGATYFLTLLYSVFFPKIKRLRLFAAVQLCGDMAIISLLVLSTGGQDSIFLFFYLIIIIGAAFVLYRRGAFLVATGSLAMLALVLFGTMYEGIRTLAFVRATPLLQAPELLYILVVHTPAFYLVAFLSSHLVEQLRHTGEILKQQQIDFDNLEALQKDVIQSLTSGLLAADLEGRIQLYNACACDLMGISGETLLGRPLPEVFPDLEELWALPHEILFHGKRREEILYHGPDGLPRTFGCSFSPLHNRENVRIGVLLLFQDLTPIKQIEEIAREREKLASIGGMAAGLAHEIRNPLSSLSGAVQLLRSELSLSGDDLDLMDIVVREADRLNSLLTDFLLFARPKTLQKSTCNLTMLVKESLYLFAQDPKYANVKIHTKIEDDCEIEVDPQLFVQVLWNLLLNGAQAMQPEGGAIEVDATQGTKGTSISVTDHGSGIPKPLQEQIFEPFFSTKASGTGLGLAVVHRIIAEHGGHIELDNSFTSGTRFYLFFPSERLFTDTPIEHPLPPKSRDELLAMTISEQKQRRRASSDSNDSASAV